MNLAETKTEIKVLSITQTLEDIWGQIYKMSDFINDYELIDLIFDQREDEKEPSDIKPKLPITLVEKINTINENLFSLNNRYENLNNTFGYILNGEESPVAEPEFLHDSSLQGCCMSLHQEIEKMEKLQNHFHTLTCSISSDLKQVCTGELIDSSNAYDTLETLIVHLKNLSTIATFSNQILEEFNKKLK